MVVWSSDGRRSRSTHQLLGALAVLLGIWGITSCSNDGCRRPVDQLDCKATFDQQVQWGLSINTADDSSECPVAGPCGAHLVWRWTSTSAGIICVYDSSGQQLLSARSCSDLPLACGANSFCMTGGQSLDVQNDCDLWALPSTCASDGGQDSD